MMGTDSKIQWTHHTFNPWRGCTKVSEGCRNCYAEKMSGRNPSVLGIWGPSGQRAMAAQSYWRQPIKWNREAGEDGERRRVFCASLADVFEGPDTMPRGQYSDVRNARARLFQLIEETPNLDWLLLTKRPENIEWQVLEVYRDCLVRESPWPLPNAWIGTSIENKEAAENRIPHLQRCKASVRFLSCEPLLGPLDFLYGPQDWGLLTGIDWVIVGCESNGKRVGRLSCDRSDATEEDWYDWAITIAGQCKAADVAYFTKQCPSGGKVIHDPDQWSSALVRQYPRPSFKQAATQEVE